MSRLAVNPAAASTAVGPGQSGARGPSSDDGAGFEVAIRSQLDSGRAAHPRDRVDPADPRGRSVISERSQRPSPETRFERPDRGHSTSTRPPKPADRVSADSPTRSRDHVGTSTAARERTSETSGCADATTATPGTDPTNRTDPTNGSAAAQAPVVDAGTGTAAAAATGRETAAGTSATSGAPTGPAVVPGSAEATSVAPAQTPTGGPTTPGTTGTPAQDGGVVGEPGGDAGQPGAGGQGAGQPGSGQPDAPVPSLVHGRPAALAGATVPRSEVGADTPSAMAGVPLAGDPSATATPAAMPAVATVAPVVPTASADATAATLAPAAPTTGTATAATAATVTTAPAANPVIPLPPQAQVLSAVSPLLTGPDGTHRVTVTLEPENLGKVRVQLSLSGGEVALHLVAADAATREALRQGLPELRAQLEQSGLRTAGMDVQSGSADLFGQTGAGAGAGTGNAGGGPAHRAGHGAIPSLRTAGDASPATNPTSRTLSHDVALDVRM